MTGYPSIDKPWLKYYSEEVINAKLPKKTLYRCLKDNNADFPNNTALNYFNNKIDYKTLIEKTDITAAALSQLGIKNGDIITFLMPTLPETVYLLYAISKIGAIANMVDPRTSADGIKKYICEVKSKVIVTVEAAYEKLSEITNELEFINKIIVVSPADSLPLPIKILFKLRNRSKIKYKQNCIKWENFYSLGDKRASVEEKYIENRPVVIVHTGGTTGFPKGVVLTNDNLNAAAYQCLISGIDMRREHTWLNIMPPFIAYGVGNGLHLPLIIGMEVYLIPQFDPNKFDRLIIKYKPNHMVGVPSHYGNLIKSKNLVKADLSYIIAPTVGGDTMDKNLEIATNSFLKEHNCEYAITKGYGMTEVCAAVSVCISNECNKLGSVGIPFSHTLISIFDPDTDKELKYGEPGEICISGPNTMLGYFNNEKETNHIIKRHSDGELWVHSGDIGYMTEEGFLYILDRLKRIIIRHDGFKIFPSEIEKCILSTGLVKNVAAVKIPDNEHVQGYLPAVFIVPNEENINNDEIEEKIKNACKQRLPEYSLPKEYYFIDSLPLTPIGKVDYLKLENL